MGDRYPEKKLQHLATNWLQHNRGYVETYSDIEARGARVDSVGLLQGRLALIEVKPRVGAAIVEHRSDRSHSLESKIAGAIGPLYRRENDPVAEAGNRLWDRQRPPLIAILTQAVSDLDDLKAMLVRRSEDWHFDFAVWRWSGSQIEVLASHERASSRSPASYETIPIPQLVGRTARARARSVGQLIAIAEERGVGDLVSHLVRSAPNYGFKVGTGGRWTIVLKRQVDGHTHPQVVIGAYLDASSPTGLNIGCWCEAVGISADELPGVPARSAGFLNTNRIVTGTEEIDAMLQRFSVPQENLTRAEERS